MTTMGLLIIVKIGIGDTSSIEANGWSYATQKNSANANSLVSFTIKLILVFIHQIRSCSLSNRRRTSLHSFSWSKRALPSTYFIFQYNKTNLKYLVSLILDVPALGTHRSISKPQIHFMLHIYLLNHLLFLLYPFLYPRNLVLDASRCICGWYLVTKTFASCMTYVILLNPWPRKPLGPLLPCPFPTMMLVDN